MRRKQITLHDMVDQLLKEGFSDVLVDTCGLWVRQPDNVKARYGKLFVSYVDRTYDEHIAFVEVEYPALWFL